MLPNIKNNNPSVYKQAFYNFLPTFSYFLFQIAIPSACQQFLIFSNAQNITTSLPVYAQTAALQHLSFFLYLYSAVLSVNCFVSAKFYGIL